MSEEARARAEQFLKEWPTRKYPSDDDGDDAALFAAALGEAENKIAAWKSQYEGASAALVEAERRERRLLERNSRLRSRLRERAAGAAGESPEPTCPYCKHALSAEAQLEAAKEALQDAAIALADAAIDLDEAGSQAAASCAHRAHEVAFSALGGAAGGEKDA